MFNGENYGRSYFASAIFETDYDAVAHAIVNTYHPQTVIDVGCGPGKLSMAIARLGVAVTAIDGFSEPHFGGLPIKFCHVNLNDPDSLTRFIGAQKYDVAICVEVAEHLDPPVSSALIAGLAAASPIVVFSAGVLDQGGHGHVNLRPRDFWHQEFVQRKYLCADRLRPLLRGRDSVALWYQFNVVDYIRADHPSAATLGDVFGRLVAAESYSTSAFFKMSHQKGRAEAELRQFPVNWAVAFRRLVKRIVGR